MNQQTSILHHLRHAELSQLVAFNKLGVCRLSERIREIESRGFAIDRRTATMTNRHDNTVRYTVYSLPATTKNLTLFYKLFGKKEKK